MLVRSLLLSQICRLITTKLTFSKETVTRKGNAIISQKEESWYCNYDYSKNPHTRTPIFGVQANWVLIYRAV